MVILGEAINYVRSLPYGYNNNDCQKKRKKEVIDFEEIFTSGGTDCNIVDTDRDVTTL